MFPAVELRGFQLHDTDDIGDDIVQSLGVVGERTELPWLMLAAVGSYLERYVDADGVPVFSGGTYFRCEDNEREPGTDQLRLDMVDSYSMSVSLCLASLAFIKNLRSRARTTAREKQLDETEAAASKRLTAAMVGLLRSFAVYTFPVSSDAGRELLRRVNQGGLGERDIVRQLRAELAVIRAGLREVTFGVNLPEELTDDAWLFECGWSWGVVEGAPEVDIAEQAGQQPEGVAQNAPYLFSTVVALDGITDLFSERTRVLNLLSPEQLRLAASVQLRWELTQRYWATIAMLGGAGRWPIEDLPWRTTDGVESDYFTLLVTAIAIPHLRRSQAQDSDLLRLSRVLEQCGIRGKVTARPIRADPAVSLHSPGVQIRLDGSEKLGPPLVWTQPDYAAMLLKRSMGVFELIRSTDLQTRLGTLADNVWRHLVTRQLSRGLWDQPNAIYSEIAESYDRPSWYLTERVVESLVQVAQVVSKPPLSSPRLVDVAGDLLNEADALYAQQMLSEATGRLHETLMKVDNLLREARKVVVERPGSAMSLAYSALQELQRISAAKQDS
jgi:hypothetical protein